MLAVICSRTLNFYSVHCYVVHSVVSKMANFQEHARCVGLLASKRSNIHSQRNYHTHFKKSLSIDKRRIMESPGNRQHP
jgi:hypothetical protein